jgi:hypothetical protein
MFLVPTFTRRERSIVGRLQLLGMEGEQSIRPRSAFREQLRAELLASGSDGAEPSATDCRALAGC